MTNLDFSIWHPLDHWPYSERCSMFYGGGYHHLKIAWQLKWSDWLAARTWCKLGRHEFADSWRGIGVDAKYLGRVCRRCGVKP